MELDSKIFGEFYRYTVYCNDGKIFKGYFHLLNNDYLYLSHRRKKEDSMKINLNSIEKIEHANKLNGGVVYQR